MSRKKSRGLWNNNNVWWLQFTPHKGAKRVRMSTGIRVDEQDSEEKATAILEKIKTDIRMGKFFPDMETTTMQGLKDMWFNRPDTKTKISLEDDEQRFEVILEFFESTKPLSLLRHADIDAFSLFLDAKKKTNGEPISTATKNRYRGLLRAALKWAKARGVVVHDSVIASIAMEQENNQRDRVCSREEFDTITRAIAADVGKRKYATELKLAVIIAYFVPLRAGAILDLERRNINTTTKRATVKASDATNKQRPTTVPLPEEAIEIIKSSQVQRLDGKIFSMSGDELSALFREYAERAGAHNLHFHDLKHTALTNLQAKGLDIFQLKAISGNKTLASLERYIHPNNEAGEKAIRELEKNSGG